MRSDILIKKKKNISINTCKILVTQILDLQMFSTKHLPGNQ